MKRPKHKFLYRSITTLLFMLLCFDAAACKDMARTELEKAYCAIKAKGKGSQLPAFNDFKKNPENIQRLLLKSAARKTGILLPAPSQSSRKQKANIQQKKSTADKLTQNIAPAAAQEKTSASTGLENCRLRKETIQCPSRQYRLQTNKLNSELLGDALSPMNRLFIPARRSQNYRNVSDLIYLSETYPIYIDKMLSIGLGDSTMSFTRYAATYDEVSRQNESFSKRFSMMFELLKTDKASNGIKRRYDDSFPEHISHCMELSHKLIVCDNVNRNWVFSKI